MTVISRGVGKSCSTACRSQYARQVTSMATPSILRGPRKALAALQAIVAHRNRKQERAAKPIEFGLMLTVP